MSENLDRVKDYLLDLGLTIVAENEAEELVVVTEGSGLATVAGARDRL